MVFIQSFEEICLVVDKCREWKERVRLVPSEEVDNSACVEAPQYCLDRQILGGDNLDLRLSRSAGHISRECLDLSYRLG